MQNSIDRLNILFLCSWYPNTEQPTLGNFVQKHAEAANRENNVTVLSIISSPKKNVLTIIENKTNGVDEVLVYYKRFQSVIPFLNKFINYFRNKKAFKKGFEHAKLQKGKFDLIHLNVIYPLGIWAKKLKQTEQIPFVITEHSNGFHLDGNHAYPSTILKLCTSILKEASYILPVSINLQNHLKQLAPKANYKVVSNVVNESLFSIEDKKNNDKVKFVHISTGYDPQKNVSGILHVFRNIAKLRNDFELHIISDGDIEYAKKNVTDNNLSTFIFFHPTKTTAEVALFLTQCDALLLFSNYENFPCVIAEAFISGVPVISTNVNGIPEHVKEWNGILVNKGSEHELEKAIIMFLDKKLIVDKHKLRTYALEHFSYDAVGKSFDSIYRKVLNH